jgi:predicted enzyme related to lactoylglutathione lyase
VPGTTRFCRIELRTTDVDAARVFYAEILGEADTEIVPLPAEAAERGAPAHWLGHLGVDDVEHAVRAFVARGAIKLGPTRPTADGGEVAIIRDPGSAVVALATRPLSPARTHVVWHLLHTNDVERAAAMYCELFGWQLTEHLDLGAFGVLNQFAFGPNGTNEGAIARIAGRPGIHPHWLFHFRVAALEPALVFIRARGGLVLGPTLLPSGERIAVCEDPQGAAFALRECLSDTGADSAA